MTLEPAADDRGPEPQRPRRGTSSIGVGVVLAIAGLLFATSASTSQGTQLRSERSDLADLLGAQTLKVQQKSQQVARLHKQVDQETAQNSQGSSAVRELEQQSQPLAVASGLTPLSGPGLVVTLDDAPRDAAVPAQAGPDDLVVHQQDVQAVVNALWAGGAQAMMLQDQRVISTSAVRCVGNTLILQGRVYSPPYSITAIGDVTRLRAALKASPEISIYLQYVAALQLGWDVQQRRRITAPAYAGSLTLEHASALGATGPATPQNSTRSRPSSRSTP